MARTLKLCLGVVSLVALLLISGYGTAEAVKAHPDACNACHRLAGANPRAINNMCLTCHVSTGSPEAVAAGVFKPEAASNAFNHNGTAGTGAGSQTSHFWGGSKTADPAAGSQNPPTTFYSSRNQISTGLVTCSICHDPHNDMATTTKLLRTTTAATTDLNDAVCKQCHVAYYIDNPSAVLTHPVGPTAVPTVDPLKFNAPVVNIGSGNIQFFNGSVSCSSCHSTHFADSNSTTVDGKGETLAAGDGKLLRTDGPLVTDPDPQVQADRRSAVCTACHPYKTHGNATESLSCFVCHSVHNPTAATNVFVLRNSVTTATYGSVTGLSYTTVPPFNLAGSTSWADIGATTTGYCEKCHGNLLNPNPGGISENRTHIEGENCRTCHVHHKADATRSFAAAGGCDGCHGYPPSANVLGGPNGYAAGYTPFKDESATPHAAHAAGSGNYSFSCTACHLNNNHNSGSSFQDVFLGADAPIATGNGNMSPTYTATGSGTCANVYCHSNGGARSSDVARTYTAASIPVWTAGSTTGAITTCNACHDNSNSMTNGSAAHAAHLALAGVTCKTCHVTTADSATLLAAGAIGGTHVNGTINVAFDTSGFITVGATPYTAATGTCAVYCHSNGVSFASPDWDVTTSGDCGACHQYSLAGVATGTGTALSATHNKHLYTTYNGVQLTCTTCHTNAGSGADHVNGSPSFIADYQNTVCNLCHGASNGVSSGDDRQPIWNNTASVDCQTCHAGSVTATISSKSAANKSNATSTGHNKASGTYGVSGNDAANKVCSSCHDSVATGHFDGITGDDMRLLPAAATCTTSCHGVGGSAVKDGIINHRPGVLICSDCHDPHGSNNIYMVKATSAGHYSGTVAFTALTGADSYDENDAGANTDDVCATCHSDANGTAHNNQQGTGVAHNEGSDCFTCHKSHTEASGAFIAGAGTACNDCHGFPPANAAHAKHAQSVSNDKDIEDRSDCEACHTGAASYTYSPATDQGASLNHGNATGRKSILTTSVGYNDTDKNCATACHKSSAADGFWADTALNCDACHYSAVTPTSAGNNAGVANVKTGTYQLTGTHNQHFDASAVCSDCHGTLPTDLTHITLGVGTDAAKILGKAKAEMDEASIDTVGLVATDADPGNATCANIACHNPSNGTYSATWTVTIADCSTCHSATDPVTGSHPQHMGAATTFGINSIACTSCHVDNGTNNAHRNGSVTFTGGIAYASNSCTTTACHNDGKGVAVPTPTWGTPSVDCTICHGNAPATGAHASHANATYVAGSCADCHTAANVTTHINGVRNMASKVTDMDLLTGGNQLTAPGGWNGTCLNSCHIANTANDWTVGTLACTDCHGSGKVTTPALDRSWPPSSGAHDAHVGSVYVAANCVDCHNNNNTTHSTLNNVVTTALGLKLTANPGNGSCTNTCHVAAQASDWTGGSTAILCLDCHSSTYIGGGANAPISGLHTGTLTVSANTHDDNFNNGNAGTASCATCHTSTPSSGHLNGVFTASAPTITLTANIGFTDAGTPTCSPTSALATCHDDGGAWKRLWSSTAKNSDGTQCANCHGDFSAGFVTGMSLRHQTSASGDANGGIGASHDGTDKCYTCHNYKAGSTTYYNMATDHRDGKIRINSNVGFVDNGTTVGCTSCHVSNDGTADGGHEFTDTTARWTREQVLGPAADCNSCHTSNGRTHGDASENNTLHNTHIASGYTAGCINCHNHDGSGVDHNNGTVNFGGTYMTTGADYSGAAFGGSCLNTVNGCHDSDLSGDWAGSTLGADSCADCHTASGKLLSQGAYPPVSNEHTPHLGNNALVPNDCSDCHGANAATGAHTGHKDTLKTVAAEISVYTAVDGTCTNSCHVVVDGRDWTSGTTLACADCHDASGMTLDQSGYPPTTREHTSHLNNNVYVANDCADCHGANATAGTHSNHKDGTLNFGGQLSVYSVAAATCTNSCHDVVEGRDWASATDLACADCHASAGSLGQGAYPPVSAKHAEHLNNNAYVTNDCTDCHGTNATAGTHSGHKDGTIQSTLTYASATQTCTNSCHLANTTGDWTVGGALACLDCHSSTFIGGGANAPTSGLHTGTLTISGNAHDDSFDNGNAGTANCETCHTTAPSSAHINGVFTNTSPSITLTANVGFIDATTPTCGPTSGLATCHDDGGAWKRKWSTSAKNSNGTECANCHGDFTTGFVTGMSLRHQTAATGDANNGVANNHDGSDKCYTCHSYKAGDITYYNFATDHRDGAIRLNSNVGIVDNGATIGCSSCHAANDGTADGQHEFTDTTARWTRESVAGPAADCNSCHISNGRTHGDSSENATVHTNHIGSGYTTGCANCHSHAGSGPDHNNGTVNFGGTYMTTGANYSVAAFGGSCLNTVNGCHDSDLSGDWAGNTLGADACADCHAATGKLLAQGSYPPVSAEHTTHINNNALVPNDCSDCHGTNASTGAHTGHIDTLKTVASAVSVYTSATGTCTNTCHTVVDGRDWTSATALICADCHAAPGKSLDQGAYPPVSNEHTAHLDSNTYVPNDCSDCHGATATAGTHTGHKDGIKTVGTSVSIYTSIDGTCTNTCHAVVNGRDWTSATTLNCTDCHSSGKSIDAGGGVDFSASTGPHTERHDAHLANTTFVANGCVDCHGHSGSLAAGGHLNGPTVGDVTLTGTISAFSGSDGSCTNSCHTVTAATNGDWIDVADLACTNCHGSGKVTTPALDRGWPPVSGAHAAHVGNTVYVNGANCTDCHNNNATTHSTINNVVTTAIGTKLTANPANGSCTNSCHLASSVGDWTGGSAAIACLDCHSSTFIGGGVNAPTSGLHTGTMTISANTHDDSFADGNAGTATCTTCHTSTPSSAHLNGTFSNSSPTITLAANVGFIDAATPTCGPSSTLASCHDDGGTWKRKWSTTAKNSDGTQCANCHGDFTAGFVTGMSLRHQTTTSGDAGGQIAANHDGTDKCYTCHNYKAGDTTYYNFATDHRDGSIRLNSNAGIVDNGTTVGCSSCHVANDGTADGQHEFTDTTARWTRESIAGPAADCTSCHNSNGRTHGDASENLTVHDNHIASGYVPGGCTDCHSNAGPGNAAHNNGTVNFGGTYMTNAADYSAAAFGGSCLNTVNGCHDSDLSGDWAGNTLGADACADCHGATGKLLSQGAYPPVSAEHTPHVNNNALVPNDCGDCHGANAETGAHTGHMDQLKTLGSQISLYSAVNGTCTNTCHIVVDGRDWTSATTLNCADCHVAAGKSLDQGAYPPVSNEHTQHLNNNTLVPNDCSDCHGVNATVGTHTGHMNGIKTIASQVSVYTAATGTCTNTCHTVVDGRDWTSATTLTCADCHAASGSLGQGGYPPVSAKHTVHLNNNAYVLNDCTACHGTNAVTGTHTGHMNGTVTNTITYAPATQTCTITCHLANTTGDWTAGGALACLDCHSSTYIGSGANAPASGLHLGPLTISGNAHDDSFNDGNAGTATCVTCHTATPSSAHINGTFTNTSPTITVTVNVGFIDAATPTCGPTSTLASCHDDGGAWKRKWSTSAKNSNGTECANCHGDFTAGFVTGMGARHQTTTSGDAGGQIAANHDGTDKCYTCHNYKAGDITYYNFSTNHRDANIQLNSNVGIVDNGTTVGCSFCHSAADGTADGGHEFADTTSRWTRQPVAGPSISCASCHAYPPVPADGKAAQAVEGKGAHAKHVTHIATRAGVTLNANTDTFNGATSTAVCGVCHDVSTTANHNTAGGTRHLLLQSSHQFGGTAPTFNGTVGVSSSVDPKSCSSLDCHFKETPVWAPIGGE